MVVLNNIIFIFSELSQAVVDAGAVPLLVLCIQEPELDLKRIAASALSDICKHSPEVSIVYFNIGFLPWNECEVLFTRFYTNNQYYIMQFFLEAQ